MLLDNTISLTIAHSQGASTKHISKGDDGKLSKQSRGISYADFRLCQFPGLRAFADSLQTLTPEDVLIYGVPRVADGILVPQSSKEIFRQKPGYFSRTRTNFRFPDGGALLMLDYDPDPAEKPRTCAEITDLLFSQLLPEANGCGYLWWPSAGSCIFDEVTDAELVGIHGQRFLLHVQHGTDIPRIGKIMQQRAWLKGLGRIDIGKAGQLLERGLFDWAVFQPERVDYLAGATCGEGLVQRRPAPLVVDGPAFASTMLIDEDGQRRQRLESLPPNQLREVSTHIAQAKAQVQDKATAKRWEWATANADQLAAKQGISREQSFGILMQATETSRLMADVVIRLSDGVEVSVGELLDNPDLYHDRECCDPLEPDYRSDSRIGIIKLRSGGTPYIYSHAHGGRRFTLHRARQRIELVSGEHYRAVDATLDVLRKTDSFYEIGQGGESVLVRLIGTQSSVINDIYLRRRCEQEVEYFVQKQGDDDQQKEFRKNAPISIAKEILAMSKDRGFPLLRGVISVPCVLPKGRVLDTAGFDSEAELLLIMEEGACPKVPLHPPLDAVATAVAALWKPFAEFPFVDAVARGVHLAALLTAPCRSGLSNAPGIGYTASTVGSGKTLLAKCVANLADGQVCLLMPTDDESEMRKQLLAIGLASQNTLVIDNMSGHVTSDALAAAMTSGKITGRILGVSHTTTVPFNMLLMITGNNLSFSSDLARRILQCRIEPNLERPDNREFGLDPESYVRDHRMLLAEAVCTIIRGYLTHGERCGKGSTASYEEWDFLIRQTVCWLAAHPELCGSVVFADPVLAIDKSMEEDPDKAKLGGFLEAMWAWRGSEVFRVADLCKFFMQCELDAFCRNGSNSTLADVLEDIASVRGGKLNPRSLGKWLSANKDRLVNDLRIVQIPGRKDVQQWMIQAVTGSRPTPIFLPQTTLLTPRDVLAHAVGHSHVFSHLTEATQPRLN